MKTRAGQLIQDYRTKHGLTQKQFADELGMAQSTLSDIENGNINPSLGRARRIARLIGVTIGELLAEPAEAVHA